MENSPHKKGRLQDTFMVFFVAISCVPLLLLGALSLISITESHRKNISNLEHQALLRAEGEVTIFFDSLIETLSTNFDTLDTTTLAKADSLWQETYTKKFLEDNKAFIEVSFINPQGKETAKSSRFNQHQNLLYFSEYPLFKKALKGEVIISDIHRTVSGQTVTVAVPSVLNGSVVGVVVAEVDLKPLINTLNKITVGETGYMLLFDKQGTLISSSVTDSVPKNIDFSKWDMVTRTLTGDTSNALSPRDRYISPITNLPVVSSSYMISKINWPIIVEWPTEEANSLIVSFRNKILQALFFSIVLVLILAPLLAKRLVGPIKKLEDVAHEIEQGNFDKKVEIKTNDELEELGESFNTMGEGLRQLEELKNEFVYVAAHELRSPVTAIKGYLEIIFEGGQVTMTPELERFLSPVRASNNRLVNLVGDLLKVARSEAGKLEIAIEPVDIRKEVQAILDEVKPLALKRNITVTYQPQDGIPMISANAGSFKEIIMNFVSNSIKYGNDNGTLTLSHEVTADSVVTHIADNGRGISDEDQKHLFEKFFRAGEVKKTTIEGTGLGLFITKQLIEKMGGTISVTSKLGEGTTFTVTFKKAGSV